MLRSASLLFLLAGCATGGGSTRGQVIGMEAASRRDQLMVSQALEEAASRAALAMASKVHGQSVSIRMQDGARPGASLLANLLERDLVRGGATEVRRSDSGDRQLRIMLKAHGLEQSETDEGVEITAFVDVDLRLLDGRGRPLDEMRLRVHRVERIDAEGFRTRIDARGGSELVASSGEEPARQARRERRSEESRWSDRGRDDERRAADRRRDEERRAADRRRDEEAAERAAEEEAERRAEEDRRAEETRRAKERTDEDLRRTLAEKRREEEEAARAPAVEQPKLNHRSHCKNNEQIMFSCKLRGNQVVSLCASVDLRRDEGWMLYRFGPSGKVVTTFPESRRNSTTAFSFAGRDGKKLITWSIGPKNYEVWAKETDPFAERAQSAAGFHILKGSRKYRDWKCIGDYAEDLGTLEGIVLDAE